MQTVQIPGGEAVMLDQRSELTPGRTRKVELLSARIGRVVGPMAIAGRIFCEGDLIEDRASEKDDQGELLYPGADVNITESQLALTWRLNDLAVLSLLKSWTLPRPLPVDESELLDLPPDVFSALRREAAKINAEMSKRNEGFTVDSIENPDSPTGRSAD